MAKAREIPGLSTELPFGEVAARVLEVRTAELADSARGVLNVADIDRVHDMRVTTRRLRAAIEVFWPCFPGELRRVALAEVKSLADALGERRDRDVAIEFLESFAAAMPNPDRPGVRSLIGHFEVEQLGSNEDLAPHVEGARLERLCGQLGDLAAAARRAASGDAETEAAG